MQRKSNFKEKDLVNHCQILAQAQGFLLILTQERKERKGFYKNLNGKGFPDCILLHPNYKTILVEFKNGNKNKLSTAQSIVLSDLDAKGYLTKVIKNSQEFLSLLNEIKTQGVK